MTDNSASPSSGSKRALIIAGSLIAALAVVYFSFFYPPVSTSDTEGTIGAVKKYRAEQITEKDVVLEGMASMNIEAVNQAVEQTGAKLAQSAREAGKTAEEALATARTAEERACVEGVIALANKVEALKAGDPRTPFYQQVAAAAEMAKESAARMVAMTAETRTTEWANLAEQARLLEKYSSGMRDLVLRMEYMKLSNAAQQLAVQAEGIRMAGKAADWQKLSDAAAALARQADGLTAYARQQEEASRFSESVTAFARAAHDRFTASGRQASETAQAAVEASKVMAGRAQELARPQGDQRTGQSE